MAIFNAYLVTKPLVKSSQIYVYMEFKFTFKPVIKETPVFKDPFF